MNDSRPSPAPPAQEEHNDPRGRVSARVGGPGRSEAQALAQAVAQGDRDAVRACAGDLHPADFAALIGVLTAPERQTLIALLGDALDPRVLGALDGDVRGAFLAALEPGYLARAIRGLESDNALALIEDLDDARQREVLARIPESSRAFLERALAYPDNTAARIMERAFVVAPPFWTVGQIIDFLRATPTLPETFHGICVVNPAFQPIGVLSLGAVLRARRHVVVTSIMTRQTHAVPAAMDQEDVAHVFRKYDLFIAPVTDDGGRLIGVITADDIADVVSDEAEEDLRRLGGVGGETLSASVFAAVRGRFSWLFVNLLTAIAASVVIVFFAASIEQMVALAVLMPIVASMGGNAATQTLTITVRALAARGLGPLNAWRSVVRESAIGLINGGLFALMAGAAGGVWFQDWRLGCVLAAALVVNMTVAALAGIVTPLCLSWTRADPAVASPVLVTTITDVVGFLSFLGLGAWLLV